MNQVRLALDRLRRAALAIPGMSSPYPLLEPRFGPGCCDGELEELRQGFRGPRALPEDYVEYLSLCRRIDAADVFNGYFLFSPLRLCGSAGPSSVQVPDLGIYDEVFVLSVGGDGGGNLFVMGTSPSALGFIWKWNHECPPRFDGVALKGVTLVARGFTEFLDRIAEDWEHFAAGDKEWAYVSG
jgi:hypothetical protein